MDTRLLSLRDRAPPTPTRRKRGHVVKVEWLIGRRARCTPCSLVVNGVMVQHARTRSLANVPPNSYHRPRWISPILLATRTFVNLVDRIRGLLKEAALLRSISRYDGSQRMLRTTSTNPALRACHGTARRSTRPEGHMTVSGLWTGSGGFLKPSAAVHRKGKWRTAARGGLGCSARHGLRAFHQVPSGTI